MFIKRLGFISILSFAVTGGLLALMAALIRSEKLPAFDEVPGHVIVFHRVMHDVEPKPTDRRERPEKAELPPPPPAQQKTRIDVGGLIDGGIPVITPEDPIDIGDLSGGGGVAMYIAPEYPGKALRLGIEGYAIVEFTVTGYGAIENARVIEAMPEGYFEKAALEAIRKFKFSAPVVDGKAVDMPGMLQKFTFELDKQQS